MKSNRLGETGYVHFVTCVPCTSFPQISRFVLFGVDCRGSQGLKGLEIQSPGAEPKDSFKGCNSRRRHRVGPASGSGPGVTTRKYLPASRTAAMAAAAVSRTLLPVARRRLWGFTRRLPLRGAAAQVSLAPPRRRESRCLWAGLPDPYSAEQAARLRRGRDGAQGAGRQLQSLARLRKECEFPTENLSTCKLEEINEKCYLFFHLRQASS